MKKEVYQQLKTYTPGTPLEVQYTFRYNGAEFEGTTNGSLDEVDADSLVLITNPEEGWKKVLNLERIITIKSTKHATTEELAGHVT